MDAETIKARLMQYPSVMIMKPEYGGGWCIASRDMESFFQEMEILSEKYDTHENVELRAENEKLRGLLKRFVGLAYCGTKPMIHQLVEEVEKLLEEELDDETPTA